ncbi:3-hydroxyacyl-CoA dehydrogenase/enoyl-CoA hydratase family protein [Aromatoleum sp.]|uniref:3-hydroxyacyl-CoA dehydrogenase/enoyl-CoA hydratase family protein n=1 Tax=Aromatoleum sp. TaxID=2307007 RepID=UPI002FC6C660
MNEPTFRKVAVLGAGVMGAQIAAHLANADVTVVLFDLAAPSGDANGIVAKALKGLQKQEPAPFVTRDRIHYIDAANYDEHLDRLGDCDLVIEAIAEKLEWKERLYAKIAPHLAPGAVVATNTSGLSLATLAAMLPARLRADFCGVHFFNPPRYMPLVELIPGPATRPDVLDRLEPWLVSRLGKGVVRAKDTPNFVANRIGAMWLLTVAHHTARLDLALDDVDALTGPAIGLPKTATFRLFDVVGLDTLAHVIDGMRVALPDDPWARHYAVPGWISALIDRGALGQKAGGGVYRRQGRDVTVVNPVSGEYRPAAGAVAPEVGEILRIRDAGRRLQALRDCPHPQARLVWSCLRDLFHYCAATLAEIADNARDVDLAMRWGYGWRRGPFEMWQEAGWREVAVMIRDDIAAGEAMADVPLPAWVDGRDGVHAAEGSWSPAEAQLKPRASLPVYRRQIFPERVLGEAQDRGETIWENDGVRLFTLPAVDAGILVASFKTKLHVLAQPVLDGIAEALARAARDHAGLVVWNEPPFAAGANLAEVLALVESSDADALDRHVRAFQSAMRSLRYAAVPTVAAVQGMALGGGCELALHCTHRVVAAESQLGLVEAGVGLIPAGGGCKEFALRAARIAAQQQYGEPNPAIYAAFQPISSAKVSKSAFEAREMGLLQPSDTILFNPHELLYVAIRSARALADAGHTPPLPPRAVKVAGRGGIATLEHQLVNLRDGGFISAHDFRVARAAAVALCGGEVEGGSLVDEQWLLDVERREFVALARTPETRARIRQMLDNGKPLRN